MTASRPAASRPARPRSEPSVTTCTSGVAMQTQHSAAASESSASSRVADGPAGAAPDDARRARRVAKDERERDHHSDERQAKDQVGLPPTLGEDEVAGEVGNQSLPGRAARRNDADGEARIAREPQARQAVERRHDRADADQAHQRVQRSKARAWSAGPERNTNARPGTRAPKSATRRTGMRSAKCPIAIPPMPVAEGGDRIRRRNVGARPAELGGNRLEEHRDGADGAECHRDHRGAHRDHHPGVVQPHLEAKK